MLNGYMSLTKGDLQAIKQIVSEEIKPIRKDIGKVEKRFDQLFNFLDKEHSKLKVEVKTIQSRLHIPTLDF
jgi:hypothetical protein